MSQCTGHTIYQIIKTVTQDYDTHIATMHTARVQSYVYPFAVIISMTCNAPFAIRGRGNTGMPYVARDNEGTLG